MCSASAPQPQPASTTRLAGAQAQLAAHVVHFRDLRLVERRLGRRVVGAGVRHRAAEPQRVELVADVVVVMDVVARAGQRIEVRAAQRGECALPQRRPAAGGAAGPVDRLQQLDQIALDQHVAVAVGIAEVQRGIGEHPAQNGTAGKGHACHRLGRARLGTAADRKLHRRPAEHRAELGQQPMVERAGPRIPRRRGGRPLRRCSISRRRRPLGRGVGSQPVL